MQTIIVTGSAGLIGSEAVRFFARRGYTVVGIDNDMRRYFFGREASTSWNRQRLQEEFGARYRHHEIDVRGRQAVNDVFKECANRIGAVIHTAAQPSHDWATKEPQTDFAVNANGTLNLLEATRQYAPEAPFVFTSTNKVYGDTPNRLPLLEQECRWEIDASHTYAGGIREDMSIDQTMHSLFGVSKVAADVLVQEYGRYFGMPTVCFRGGCLTGPNHSGAPLHGFLAYLLKCAVTGTAYTVFGYKGKQVRDNIHCSDLVRAFATFIQAPRAGEVYNIGGGRTSNCSMLEAIALCEQITDRALDWQYVEQNRMGDHIWWISDNSKFMRHYPGWKMEYDFARILQEMFEFNAGRWSRD